MSTEATQLKGTWRGTIEIGILISLLCAAPILTLKLVQPNNPSPSSNFLEVVNSNPALWPTQEPRDNLALTLTVLMVGVFTLYAIRRKVRLSNYSNFQILFLLIPLVIFFSLNIRSLDDRLRQINPGFYFEGFSPKEFLLTTFVSGFILFFSYKNSALKPFLAVGLALATLPSLIIIFQSLAVNTDITNSQFVVNELLSATSGLRPLFEFSAQYSSGLPYLVWGIHSTIKTNPYATVGLIITIFNIGLAVTIWILAKSFSKSRLQNIFYFFIFLSAFTFTTRSGASTTGYLQGTPIRSSVLIGALVLGLFLQKDKKHEYWYVYLGLTIPLFLLMNVEFGFAAAVSLCATFFISRRFASWKKLLTAVTWLVLPSLCSIIALSLSQSILDSSCSSKCAYDFIYMFGGTGYFAVPMRVTGSHQIILITFAVGTVVAWSSLFTMRKITKKNPRTTFNLEMLGIASFFGILSFQYFVNRSYAALLPQFLLNWTVCLILMGNLLFAIHKKYQKHLFNILGVVLFSMSTVVTIHRPPIKESTERIFSPTQLTNYEDQSKWKDLAATIAAVEVEFDVERKKIGIISPNYMADAIDNGVLPALPYNSPGSIVLKEQVKFACRFLNKSKIELIVVATNSVSEAISEIARCGQFKSWEKKDQFQIFVRS